MKNVTAQPTIYTSSKTDLWETPIGLFLDLDAEFHFTPRPADPHLGVGSLDKPGCEPVTVKAGPAVLPDDNARRVVCGMNNRMNI